MEKSKSDFKTETEWYRYLSENKNEVVEQDNEFVDIYYRCTKCNFAKKIRVESTFYNEVIIQLKSGKCPVCKHVGFKLIDEKEYKKLLSISKNKKDDKNNDKDKVFQNVNYAKNYIIDEREKVFKDLTFKLKNKKISPNRFVPLFYNICYDIMIKASKDFNVPNFDWLSQRKVIYDMGQEVLNLYNIKEEQDTILENYDKEADEIYLEYRTRYEYSKDQYRDDIRINKLERKNEKRVNDKYYLRERITTDKEEVKLEKSFIKSLEKDVSRYK